MNALNLSLRAKIDYIIKELRKLRGTITSNSTDISGKADLVAGKVPESQLPVYDLQKVTTTGKTTTNDITVQGINIKSDYSTNLFIGANAGQNNTPIATDTGRENFFIGSSAGRDNTTGYANLYIGYNAGLTNITGTRNTGVGYAVFSRSTDKSFNVALGTDAGYRNNSNSNMYIGYHSGFDAANLLDITGDGNMFFGERTATKALTATRNNLFGFTAAFELTDGANNNIFGYNSGFQISTGNRNCFFGNETGRFLTTGSDNTLVGHRAGFNFATTAANNSGVGQQSLYGITTGAQNAGLGSRSGQTITTGTSNTFLGFDAGNNVLQKVDAINSTAVGTGAYTTKNNQVVLGGSTIIETLLKGTVLANTTTDDGTGSKLQVNGTVSVSTPSNAVHAVNKSYVDTLTNYSCVVNTTTTALSSATLNSTYSSVPVGYRVICKDIIGAGLIYTKVTEAGSSDVWVSSPITIVV